MSKFDFQENNYFLNDKCIASSLVQTDETLSDLLVPSLRLVRDELCAASSDIEQISSDIYRNADSQVLSSRGLSGKVEFLLSSDRKAMNYGGTLRHVDPGITRPYTLSSFLADNFSPSAFLKRGFTFRISADQEFYVKDISSKAFVFSENDYFIVNRDTPVEYVSSADIDVIYDASVEGRLLSSMIAELSVKATTGIGYLSSVLSAVSSDVMGHVNYRGHVNTIRHLGRTEPHIDGLSAAFLLANFYDSEGQVLWNVRPEDGTPYFISSFALHNGWAYNIKLVDDWPSGARSYTTRDGMRLDDNDYILIHSHVSSGVELSALKPGDIDIIKNYDLSVRFLQSQVISNDSDIAFLSSALSGAILSVEDVSAHYFSTLSSVDRMRDGTIRTDNLMVTDISGEAGAHQRYYMTFKYGTLVLEKIR